MAQHPEDDAPASCVRTDTPRHALTRVKDYAPNFSCALTCGLREDAPTTITILNSQIRILYRTSRCSTNPPTRSRTTSTKAHRAPECDKMCKKPNPERNPKPDSRYIKACWDKWASTPRGWMAFSKGQNARVQRVCVENEQNRDEEKTKRDLVKRS